MARLACLRVPLFPLAARLRAEPELAGAAVAVCEGNGAAARVVAPSRDARRHGVRAGMTLAQARGVLPDLLARGRDPVAEASAREALLEAAWTLSPRVEEAAEDLAFADLDGMEGLYPPPDGERRMASDVQRAAEALHLPLWVGIAGTKLAARVAAGRGEAPTVVPDGGEAAFLAPLRLEVLAPSPRLAATLVRWGVATVGALAALPPGEAARRLGREGIAAHRAARGIDPTPLLPSHPAPTLSEGMELEWPVVTVEPLLWAVRRALERLDGRLARHELACALLELELGLEPEGHDRRAIRLPAPVRDVGALLDLVRHEVEARPPSAPVAAFTCVAHPDRRRLGQLTLFGPAELSPQALATTLARLAARLGPDRVGSPRTVDGHRPERFAVASFEPPPPPAERRPPRRGRGLLAVRVLRPPVGLEVITEPLAAADAQRPVSVASVNGATPHVQGLVRVASGPWTLEEGWWGEDPVERDYWDVELSGGGLYRIFRDRGSEEWFADGLYD